MNIAIIVCFVITWIVIICNSESYFPPTLPDFYGESWYKTKIRDLESENNYWKSHCRQLELMSKPHYHNCSCPHFTPCENFEKKYYAIDKERQDLIDIIIKGKKSAEKLIEDLDLKNL